MKTLKNFLLELYGVNVVSIDKNRVDIKKQSTINEINKNIALELKQHFTYVGDALNKVKKILSSYSIELPVTTFHDESHGEEIIPLYQFGNVTGIDISGKYTKSNETNPHCYLHFNYVLIDGSYKCSAIIKTERELNK